MEENIVKHGNAMDYLVKYAPLVILIEKNPLLQKKHKNESFRNLKRNCRCTL